MCICTYIHTYMHTYIHTKTHLNILGLLIDYILLNGTYIPYTYGMSIGWGEGYVSLQIGSDSPTGRETREHIYNQKS